MIFLLENIGCVVTLLYGGNSRSLVLDYLYLFFLTMCYHCLTMNKVVYTFLMAKSSLKISLDISIVS